MAIPFRNRTRIGGWTQNTRGPKDCSGPQSSRDGMTHVCQAGIEMLARRTGESSISRPSKMVCPRWDLNPYDLSVTCLACRCVYQFRHGGTLAVRWREPDV